MKRSPIVPWLYVAPALVFFVLLAILPIIWTFVVSTMNWNGLSDMVFIGIGNYVSMFQDSVFRQAVLNNLFFSALGTTVQIVMGLAFAMLLLSIKSFRNFVKVAYFIPCIVSSVAISQIFVKLLSISPVGVINGLLGAVGLEALQQPFLSNPNLSLLIVTLVDAYKFAAIYMVIYYSAFVTIDHEILDAATIDGCNWWQQYVYVKFPLIKGVVLVTAVMLVSGTLKGFDVSYIMTGGGPGASSELVATYMYKTIFNASGFGYGSALGVFLTVECLVIVAIIRKVFKVDDAEEAVL